MLESGSHHDAVETLFVAAERVGAGADEDDDGFEMARTDRPVKRRRQQISAELIHHRADGQEISGRGSAGKTEMSSFYRDA